MLPRLAVLLLLIFLPVSGHADAYRPVSNAWIMEALETMRVWRGQRTKIIQYELIRNSDGKDWLAVTWTKPAKVVWFNLYRVDYGPDTRPRLTTLWDLYNTIFLLEKVEDTSGKTYKVLQLGSDLGGSTTENSQDLRFALKGNAPLLSPLDCNKMILCPWDRSSIFDTKPSRYRNR